jgi:hypothetical protein
MARIVTSTYRYKRPPRTVALVAVLAAAALLAGCAVDGRPSDQDLALRGYWYHDANHQGGASGRTTQQTIYAATDGVWLWPPSARPGP